MTDYLEERVSKLEKQVKYLDGQTRYYDGNDVRLMKIMGERIPYSLQIRDDMWREYKPVDMSVWKEIKTIVSKMEGDVNSNRASYYVWKSLTEAINKAERSQ